MKRQLGPRWKWPGTNYETFVCKLLSESESFYSLTKKKKPDSRSCMVHVLILHESSLVNNTTLEWFSVCDLILHKHMEFILACGLQSLWLLRTLNTHPTKVSKRQWTVDNWFTDGDNHRQTFWMCLSAEHTHRVHKGLVHTYVDIFQSSYSSPITQKRS